MCIVVRLVDIYLNSECLGGKIKQRYFKDCECSFLGIINGISLFLEFYIMILYLRAAQNFVRLCSVWSSSYGITWKDCFCERNKLAMLIHGLLVLSVLIALIIPLESLTYLVVVPSGFVMIICNSFISSLFHTLHSLHPSHFPLGFHSWVPCYVAVKRLKDECNIHLENGKNRHTKTNKAKIENS